MCHHVRMTISVGWMDLVHERHVRLKLIIDCYGRYSTATTC